LILIILPLLIDLFSRRKSLPENASAFSTGEPQ
jgi:hypothetical protein